MKNVGEAVSELSIIKLPILKTLLFFFLTVRKRVAKSKN